MTSRSKCRRGRQYPAEQTQAAPERSTPRSSDHWDIFGRVGHNVHGSAPSKPSMRLSTILYELPSSKSITALLGQAFPTDSKIVPEHRDELLPQFGVLLLTG